VQHSNNLVKLRQPEYVKTNESVGASIRYLPKRNFKAEIYDALGPDPEWALKCFIDLGLSDSEIADYVGLSLGCVRILTLQIRAENR